MNASFAKSFKAEFGIKTESNEIGYLTLEQANEFSRLQCGWWGSNLIYLGAEEKQGLFVPYFNIWD
jgi:hypothetical protein